jgi:hypothetical protein
MAGSIWRGKRPMFSASSESLARLGDKLSTFGFAFT